ncbi:MAG: CtsR family transcriptional regulator [Syntrophomonadaceae bacterium]
MRRSLADKIEQYIKVLIEKSGAGQIEIQRSELAETFSCVPSQVTYVISTRFTQEEGYVTESRRGGNGFVRITRTQWINKVDNSINRNQIKAYLDDLLKRQLIGNQEYTMLVYVVESAAQGLAAEQQNQLFQVIINALGKYTSSL